jgi:hypothetical protein
MVILALIKINSLRPDIDNTKVVALPASPRVNGQNPNRLVNTRGD